MTKEFFYKTMVVFSFISFCYLSLAVLYGVKWLILYNGFVFIIDLILADLIYKEQ